MQQKKEISLPLRGMNRENNIDRLQDGEFVFALNSDTNGQVTHNEPSNYLNVNFPEGYKVIGFKKNALKNVTYYFLTNRETSKSSIGYVEDFLTFHENEDPQENCVGCGNANVLSEPLEQTTQTAENIYVELINDNCLDIGKGLNFKDIYPIKHIVIKNEQSGTTIYWEDNLNPPRWLNVSDTSYLFEVEIPCEDNDITNCIDIKKLLQFPEHSPLSIQAVSRNVGGNLRMGSYEYFACYCDKNGAEMSEYSSSSGVIKIFNENDRILDSTELDDLTSFSIKLNILNLDPKYRYYKVVCVERGVLNSDIFAYEEGIFSTSNDTVLSTSSGRIYTNTQRDSLISPKKEVQLNDIFFRKPKIEKAEGEAVIGSRKYIHGVKRREEVNIQPVVNLLSSLMKWQTVITNEELYKDGVISADYMGYMRDEVQPFSLRLLFKDGGKSYNFPIISRPANSEDLETGFSDLMGDISGCDSTDRDYKWQYINTAKVEKTCSIATSGTEVIQAESRVCIVRGVDEISANTIEIELNTEFDNLKDYIADNPSVIIPEITPYLLNPYPESHCIPVFGTVSTSGNLTEGKNYIIYDLQPGDDFSNVGFTTEGTVFTATGNTPVSWSNQTEVEETVCDTPTLDEFKVSINTVEGEFVNREESAFPESYEDFPSSSCNFYEASSAGGYVRDTTFEYLYMMRLGIPDNTRKTVLKRSYNSTNEGCSSASDIINISAINNNAQRYFINYRGGETRAELETAKEAYLTELTGVNGFGEKIQSGALWFKANTLNRNKFILEVSKTQEAPANDDIIETTVNPTQKVRVSLFHKCSDTQAFYGEIIPIRTQGLKYRIESYRNTDSRLVITGTSGSASVIINLESYPMVFDTDIDTTINNFMLENGTELEENGIRISIEDGIISLRSAITLTVNVDNLTGDLDGTSQNDIVIINNTVIPLVNPFASGDMFVAIDPWVNQTLGLPKDDTQENGYDPEATPVVKFRTAPPDGCFAVVTRDVTYDRATVSWTSIILDKSEKYSTSCTYFLPDNLECEPIPYKQGEFSFWESTRTYPDNKDLYDSSGLKIEPSDIPSDLRTKFEQYYAEGLDDDNYYTLKEGADFRCAKIRHPKMPDNRVAPFIANQEMPSFTDSFIYPLGVHLDARVVEGMLKIAVRNNLMTQKEADNVFGFEILRGDNTYSKSVISNGLMFDMYQYDRDDKQYLYSNFPYNDLGGDLYHKPNRSASNVIQHPYQGEKNNKFTYISPDLLHTKTQLGTEISIQGYLKGTAKSNFTELEDHPKWTILGRKARNTATTLAVTEVVLETAISVAELTSSQFFMAGFVVGTSLGLVGAILAGVAYATSGFVKSGQYRYDWIKSFRDIGASYNFAYYGYSLGKYNNIIVNRDDANYFKPLSISRYLPDGDFSLVDTKAGETYNINNFQREGSVFLALGDNFLEYSQQYQSIDNSNIKNTSSKATSSTIGCDKREFSPDIASPYVTMKNYVPDQYGDIDTVRWLTTGKIFEIGVSNNCEPVFGGNINITRFTYKRKIPFFRRTAFGTPDKTTYEYSTASNIGFPRFYCDYETDTEFDGFLIPMPDIDSDYEFDCKPGGNKFYIRPSKFYTAYYSVVDFLVESEMNLNMRYANKDINTHFYPVVPNLEFLTQEKNISIKEPNSILYSNVFSLPRIYTNTVNLPTSYDRKKWNQISQNVNEIIWSELDNSEYDNFYDPYLVYKPLNSYDFDTDSGKLKSLKESTRNQAVARFTDGMQVFNTVDNLAERITAQTKELGTGGIFTTKPVEFVKSSLGFTGTQHHNVIETEFGDIHIDSERGQVIFLSNGADKIEDMAYSFSGEISNMQRWFKKQLPFKIKRFFKDADIDNPFLKLGISGGYDAVNKRFFLTKLDAVPISDCIEYDPETGFVLNLTNCEGEEPQPICNEGYTYNPVTQLCERATVTSSCPVGFEYNTTTGKCEKDGEGCDEGLDIVFILDATSSQSGAINGIKDAISSSIVPSIIAEFGSDYRLGLIAVKDRRGIGQPLFDILAPMAIANETPFLTAMNTIFASGGAGLPEPSDLALKATLDNTVSIDFEGSPMGGFTIGTFRENAAKAIILVTDAPPSGLTDSYTLEDWVEADALAEQSSSQGIQIFPFLTAGNQPFPIPPNGGLAPNITYLMQNYANKTGGTYYYNQNGVGIGDDVVDAIVNNIGCVEQIDPTCQTGCEQSFGSCTCVFTETPTYEDIKIPVEITDSRYFQDRSWTISYKFERKGWNSYFSSTPNYYNSHQDFFQVGFNSNQSKLWSHTLENASFQVFQGELKPFIVETVYANKNSSKLFDNLSINSEALRYQDNWSYAEWANKGFNKTVIYNNSNNSGNLNLKEQRAVSDVRKYPITNPDNTQDILFVQQDEKQHINYFYNRVKRENRNIPQWTWDDNNIYREIDRRAVNFANKKLLERMRGDSFIIRLENDLESRFKINYKNTENDATYYDN